MEEMHKSLEVTAPHFLIPVCPRQIPEDLERMPPGTWVRYTKQDAPRGRRSGGAGSAAALKEEIQGIIDRQLENWFLLDEVALRLQAAGCGNVDGKDGWIAKLTRAAARGELPMHEPRSLGRIEYDSMLTSQSSGTLSAGIGYMDFRRVRPYYDWVHVDDLNRWLDIHEPRLPFRFERGVKTSVLSAQSETAEQRQARRYQMCIDAGLVMPDDDYSHLPRGIGKLAMQEGVTRQSFSADLKAYLARVRNRVK